MLLSKSTEYGIRIVIYLLKVGSNGYVRIQEISNHCNVPLYRLSKVAQKLTREGLLESYTGPNPLEHQPMNLREMRSSSALSSVSEHTNIQRT